MDCQIPKPYIWQNDRSWLMVLEFGQHRKRASPGLSIYIYSSTYIHTYICCSHGISCSDPQLEHHWFEHSSLALSFSNTYPSNGLSSNKSLNLAKSSFLGWWCWNLTNITRELALIYLSTSIYIYSSISISANIYKYIYICVYLLFA